MSTTESNDDDLNRSESESDISAATQVPPTLAIDFSLGYKRVSGPMRRSTKGGWTSEEDELLTNAVQRYKGHNLVKDDMKNDYKPQWSKISKLLPGRIGKQCRERWHNHLNPTIKKTAWTSEEELVLVQAQREHGNKWAEIAKLLPGRSENCSVKKRLDQFPSNLFSGVLYGSRPCGFEYNFFNHKRSTPSTSSLREDESISSSVESDWSSLNVSAETPQSSNDRVWIQEIKRRLRKAASTFNTPSIISKRSSPALSGLKRHRQNDDTPFQIDGGSHMSSEEEHSTSPFSKYRLAKRNTCSGSKPLERRFRF